MGFGAIKSHACLHVDKVFLVKRLLMSIFSKQDWRHCHLCAWGVGSPLWLSRALPLSDLMSKTLSLAQSHIMF